jgi:hypothetical protein
MRDTTPALTAMLLLLLLLLLLLCKPGANGAQELENQADSSIAIMNKVQSAAASVNVNVA